MALQIKKARGSEPTKDPTLPPRDRWDRPMVFLPDGSKRVPYARTSGAGAVLEDTTSLTTWKSRLAAFGVAAREDLTAAIRKLDPVEDRKALDVLVEEAQNVAGMSTKADLGTRIHSLSEAVDRGEDLGSLPDNVQRAVDNYRALVARMKQELGYHVVATEQFCVNDTLSVAGTADRVAVAFDTLAVFDLKTSGSLDWSRGKFAMQFLGYAGSVRYNDLEAQQGLDKFGLGVGRSPFVEGMEVSQELAYIIWCPQHGDSGQLVPVPLTDAADGYRLASEVRDWRNRWKRKSHALPAILTVSA